MQGFASILQRILSDPNLARQLGIGGEEGGLDITQPIPGAAPSQPMPGAQDFSSPALQTMDYRPERDDPFWRQRFRAPGPDAPPDFASGFDNTTPPPVWDTKQARGFLDALRNNPTPGTPGSEPQITPQYDEPQLDIADKGDPTEDYLAKLLSEYRGQGRDFGDLQGEADQMAREQGYSPNVPNKTGFLGVLSKISRAAGGFLRGMSGEKNQDGSAVSLMSELDRYKRGTDDKEGFEMKRDELLKKEVIPRYASKRELDKERIGTLQGEIGLKEKQLKLREEIAYKKGREARLAKAGTERNDLLKFRIDSDNGNKAASRELKELEIQMKGESDADKRADTQAYATELGRWRDEGEGLVGEAARADALYKEAIKPNSAASDDQIAELRSHMAATKDALAEHKRGKPVKGAIVAPKAATASGLREPDPARKASILQKATARVAGKTQEERKRLAQQFAAEMRAAKVNVPIEEINRAFGVQ